MTTRTLVTADELLRMPDDGKRYELIEGELIEMAPAGGRHGNIGVRIVRVPLPVHLQNQPRRIVRCRYWVLPATRTVPPMPPSSDRLPPEGIPDAAFIVVDRFAQSGFRRPGWDGVAGAPTGFVADTIFHDLVVEVVSPKIFEGKLI